MRHLYPHNHFCYCSCFRFSCLYAWVGMLLWNWVMPMIWASAPVMTFWPMWGLLELCSILFKTHNYNSNNTCGIYHPHTITFKTIYEPKTNNISLNTFGVNFKFIPIGYLSITTEVFNNSCRKH